MYRISRKKKNIIQKYKNYVSIKLHNCKSGFAAKICQNLMISVTNILVHYTPYVQ